MSKVVFVLDSKGVTDLMKSSAMSGVIADACERVAGVARSSSGLELESSVVTGKNRAHGRVQTVGTKSYYKALENKALQNALGSVKV